MKFIMPYMLSLVGEVAGKRILDLGCGEGGYSRELAKRGAEVTAVDCSEKVLAYAEARAEREGLRIRHYLRNSRELSGIGDGAFDILLCSMMLMDCEDLEGTVREAARVLKPSGTMYVSVLHPCFNGEHESGIGRQGLGLDREVVVKNYFSPKEWEAPLCKGSSTPVLWRHRTLEDYVKAFVRCGFVIKDLNEPSSTDGQAKLSTQMAWLQRIPLYLYWTLEKQTFDSNVE